MSENKLVEDIYNYIKENSSKKKHISHSDIMRIFSLSKEEFIDMIKLIKISHKDFHFEIKSDLEKAKCRICRKNQGTFRPTVVIESEKKILGTFICDKCFKSKLYKKFLKKVKKKLEK